MGSSVLSVVASFSWHEIGGNRAGRRRSIAAARLAEGDQADATFGFSVASAGDVDSDGYSDVIVGAPFYDNGSMSEGQVWLYHGWTGGLSAAAWMFDADEDFAYVGWSVASAGDVDGDGFGDVIVGAPGFTHAYQSEGRVWVFLGSTAGVEDVAVWGGNGWQANAWYGTAVAGAGDVNADGFDDVIVGAPYFDYPDPDEGLAFLYLGSAGGPASESYRRGAQDGAEFGTSVAGVGDVNRDGYDEVLVGSPTFDYWESDEGLAFLYLGSAGGFGVEFALDDADQADAEYGHSVAGAGDVNGDGASDVIVSAPYFDAGQSDEGAAFAYHGSGSPGTTYCVANANSTGGAAEIHSSGTTSASAGDLMLLSAPVPNQPGLFFHGANQVQLPFGNGFLCASGGIVRGEVVGASSNIARYTYDNSDTKHRLDGYIGSTRNFRYWFRDPPAGGAFFNFSNAIAILIAP